MTRLPPEVLGPDRVYRWLVAATSDLHNAEAVTTDKDVAAACRAALRAIKRATERAKAMRDHAKARAERDQIVLPWGDK